MSIDKDQDLELQARKLHNMFKSPGMVSVTMAEELLRWILDRARAEAAAVRQPDTK